MNDDSLTFQVTDYDYYHKEIDDENKFIIRLFGKTKDEKSVYLEIEEFEIHFYFEILNDWRKSQIYRLLDDLKEQVYPKEFKEGLKSWEIVSQYKMWGFTAGKKFNFVKLKFNNYDCFKAYSRVFTKRRYKFPYLDRSKNGIKFLLYESNIDPILRFIHTMKMSSVGWISIPFKKLRKFNDDEDSSNTDIKYKTDYDNIKAIEGDEIVKLDILSFDFECYSQEGFPQSTRESDAIFQIGMTFSKVGEKECYRKVLLALKETDPIDGSDVIIYKTERELIKGFAKYVRKYDPDIITGYNIFGFDFKYLYDRAELLGVSGFASRLSRLENYSCNFIEKELKSAALGQNILKYYDIKGRIVIDLMKIVQRDYNLSSYKLDYVSSYFIREKIKSHELHNNKTKLNVASNYGIKIDQYISIYYFDGLTDNNYGNKKYQVLELIDENYIIVDDNEIDLSTLFEKNYKIFWCHAKDDVSVRQIFESYNGTSKQRSLVGKYCIQDCELVNKLMSKLQVMVKNISMAKVCHVPVTYIFLRGQGIKIQSLMTRYCNEREYLLPVIKKKPEKPKEENEEKNGEDEENKKFEKFVSSLNKKDDDYYSSDDEDDRYEGATVLDPKKGYHLVPVGCLDFASLYPNSMILKNLSHETLVNNKKYDNLPDYIYHEINYTNGLGETVINRFAEKKDGTKGIVPNILKDLLAARKKFKKKMAVEKNEFDKVNWDGLQLAYKMTANSLYGQTGAKTSAIRMKEIAASTTATGRDMLKYAKKFIEEIYSKILKLSLTNKKNELKEYVMELLNEKNDDVFKNDNYKNKMEFIEYCYKYINEILEGYTVDPEIIYGDTDSVFFSLNITDKKTNKKLTNKTSLEKTITLGMFGSDIVNILLPNPMNLEYEKVLWPFIILTKKRYVGNLYEEDPNVFKQKSMGIVLKRRDNADIVKIVCGGVIDKLLNERDPEGAVNFVRESLQNIITGKFNIDKFVITKTLKSISSYKDWTRIAHAVLAKRMAERDPGNAPQSNDRIPYVYVEVDKKKVDLQGDRIEIPSYVLENSLKLDYLFYITNQIMTPCIQFLDLVMNNADELFNEYIIKEENRKIGKTPIISLVKNNNDNENINYLDSYEKVEFNKNKKKKTIKKKIKKNVLKKEIDSEDDNFFINL